MTVPHETDARLRHIYGLGAQLLADFDDHLIGPYKLTLVARNAGFPNGSRDLVITDDDPRDVVDALQRRMLEGPVITPVGRT